MSGIPDGHMDWDDTYSPIERRDHYSIHTRQHLAYSWFEQTADAAVVSWNAAMNQACRYNRQFSLWLPKGEC